MILISKKEAIKVFYYLAAIDGMIEDEELQKLDEIGKELDGEAFLAYRYALLEKCRDDVMPVWDSDEGYDILSEKTDVALEMREDSLERGIPSRMLLWNMLVMAYANGNYDSEERRLIRHVKRVMETDDSVFMEMEELIKSDMALDEEMKTMQTSLLPYAEIKPIIDEIETRKTNLKKCITELIADEILTSVKAEPEKGDFFDKARDIYQNKITPNAQKVSENAGRVWNDVREKSAPALETTKKMFGNALGGLKNRFGRGSENKGE